MCCLFSRTLLTSEDSVHKLMYVIRPCFLFHEQRFRCPNLNRYTRYDPGIVYTMLFVVISAFCNNIYDITVIE